MNQNRVIFIIIIFYVFSSLSAFSQQDFPHDYFRSPLNIPLYLSGNFAELRSTHFHTGVDFKTQGTAGHNIYAIADGYVSRIKVQSGGYGYALYITHPNGFVSVYGHLQQYSKEISAYVLENQYKKKRFELNLFPPSDMFPVEKGQVIGLSGNSGRSSGPHLHFEIRNQKNEHPVNPLRFNFNVKDNIPPKMYAVAFYPMNRYSTIEGKNEFCIYPVNSTLLAKDTIEAYGDIGFGIRANDFLDGSKNRCGIYIMELYVDDNLIYRYQMDDLDFNELRYILSHYDYKYKIEKNRYIQKSFIAPNNKFSNYTDIENQGIVSIRPDSIYTVQYVLKDASENQTDFTFYVKGKNRINPDSLITIYDYTQAMPCMLENNFSSEGIELTIPANSLYEDLFFIYAYEDPYPGLYSKIHCIHKDIVPLHKSYKLRIKAAYLPDSLQTKALAVWVNGKNGNSKLSSAGGKYKDGYIETRLSNFGKISISVDTVPPEIKAINISANQNMQAQKNIRFKIKDKLSGIDHYKGYIDETWVLFRYDAKNDLIYYNFSDNKIRKNETHNLQLSVWDRKDNKTEYIVRFKW